MNGTTRPVQHFSDDYLVRCRDLSPDDIVRFLEDFKRIHRTTQRGSRLISIKVPEALLAAFKIQARLRGVRYQTQIKALMRSWLEEAAPTGPPTPDAGVRQ